MLIGYHPRARAEFVDAVRWYVRRSAKAAQRFDEEILRAEAQISASPESWTNYLRGTKYYSLKRFPYKVVYRVLSTHVQIIAVAHAKRRPGYWAKRL